MEVLASLVVPIQKRATSIPLENSRTYVLADAPRPISVCHRLTIPFDQQCGRSKSNPGAIRSGVGADGGIRPEVVCAAEQDASTSSRLLRPYHGEEQEYPGQHYVEEFDNEGFSSIRRWPGAENPKPQAGTAGISRGGRQSG